MQTASTYKVHVQLIDLVDSNSVTDINFGQFESNFLARRGGISLTSGKRLVSTDYTTYSDSARYTISFYMAYYIPFAGRIRILFPTEIEFISEDPYSNVESNLYLSAPSDLATAFGQMNVYDQIVDKEVLKWYVDFLIYKRLEDEDVKEFYITFDGFRNPISFESTGVFEITTFDQTMNEIAQGSIDNIKMQQMSKFNELSIELSNMTNGAIATYSIKFTTITPL